MSDVFGFNQDGTKRIVAAVRAYEHETPGGGRVTSPRPRSTRFWVRLGTEGTDDKLGTYQWRVYDNVHGTWTARTPAVQDVTNFSAMDANRATGLTGEYVELQFVGYDASTPPKPLYIFAFGVIPKPTNKYQVYTPIDDTLKPIWTSVRMYGGATTSSIDPDDTTSGADGDDTTSGGGGGS